MATECSHLLRIGIVFLLMCLFIVYVNDQSTPKEPPTNLGFPFPDDMTEEEDNSGCIVYTDGFRIPYANANGMKFKRYFKTEKPVICGTGGPLVNANTTHLTIDYGQTSFYNFLGNSSEIHCCYRPFKRVAKLGDDKNTRYSEFCIDFTNGTVLVLHEFVRVECRDRREKVFYDDFFAFVNKTLPETEESYKLPEERSRVSVLILGIDSVSRMNFYRQMPKTLNYLKNNLSAIEYQAYNKVGENTMPNLVAVLTGQTEDEFRSTCHLSKYEQFDKCGFIWKEFKKRGYKTAYVEDSVWLGTFHYQMPGFYEQPTDFYPIPFFYTAEEEVGHQKRQNCKLCLGKRRAWDVLLDVVKRYIFSSIDQLTFGFFWANTVGHDFLNLPRQADDDYYELFNNLSNRGVFEKSVVIFLSDHGFRWGKFRLTHHAYLEERLPFLFFIFPNWFRDRYKEALRNIDRNQRRLTTPFDLHATLNDLMNLSSLEKPELDKRLLLATPEPQKGTSLFLPIPKNRTCETAHIPDDCCICYQTQPISVALPKVKLAGLEIVNHLNKLLENYSYCSYLTLLKIVNARIELPGSRRFLKNVKSSMMNLKLVVQVLPSYGFMESIVRYDNLTQNTTVVGTVSRISPYGNEGDCMPLEKLRLYCFCRG